MRDFIKPKRLEEANFCDDSPHFNTESIQRVQPAARITACNGLGLSTAAAGW